MLKSIQVGMGFYIAYVDLKNYEETINDKKTTFQGVIMTFYAYNS